MKTINSYILEKFKISKDINSEEDNYIYTQLCNTINNYMQKELNFKTEEFIYQVEDDSGHIVNKDDKISRIYLYSKKFDSRIAIRDNDKIANKLSVKLNKIKKIKKTEVFVTSIYFYFE